MQLAQKKPGRWHPRIRAIATLFGASAMLLTAAAIAPARADGHHGRYEHGWRGRSWPGGWYYGRWHHWPGYPPYFFGSSPAFYFPPPVVYAPAPPVYLPPPPVVYLPPPPSLNFTFSWQHR